MDFETYLINKKINPTTFKEKNIEKWKSLKGLFDQVHPNSFTAQKLFLINKLRRKYPLSPFPET
ncbi:MAG: hypothetical protein MI674_00735 [Cytophagales bacterium]|nr:hypothetical protein [Cytophagales bacterium]